MANTFEHIYIVKKDPVQQNKEGEPVYKVFSAVQTFPSNAETPQGYAWFPEEFMSEFYKDGVSVAGLVDMTFNEEGDEVTSCVYNMEYLTNFKNTLPAFSISAIPAKLSEISQACTDSINAGTDVTFDESNPEATTFHFDFTTEDQANISSLFNTTLLGATEFPYHYKDGSCQVFTAAQLSKLYITMQTYITHHLTYHNQLKQYIIDEFTGTRDEEHETALRNIVYGATQLQGEYLAKYNEMMGVAQAQVEAVATKLLASPGIPEEGGTDTGSEDTSEETGSESEGNTEATTPEVSGTESSGEESSTTEPSESTQA